MNRIENLSKKCNIQNSQFYNYLQVKSLTKAVERNKTLSDIHPLIKHIKNTYNQVNAKNVLGDIYRIIQE